MLGGDECRKSVYGGGGEERGGLATVSDSLLARYRDLV